MLRICRDPRGRVLRESLSNAFGVSRTSQRAANSLPGRTTISQRAFSHASPLRSEHNPESTGVEAVSSEPDKTNNEWMQQYKHMLSCDALQECTVPRANALGATEGQATKARKIAGTLLKRVDISKNLSFATVMDPNGHLIQLVSDGKTHPETHAALRKIRPHSGVLVQGTLAFKHAKKEPEKNGEEVEPTKELELHITQIDCLSQFPASIGNPEETNFGPEQRHLQIRFDTELQRRLQSRRRIIRQMRKFLDNNNFTEIETPILFKSTPEGAREFLVPTRTPGLAYALPQSPQQYKQILMASGVRRYYQIAKCFRDEDLRADRQPEFTQLDLEMAFATGHDVMHKVRKLVQEVCKSMDKHIAAAFPQMTYQIAMSRHGIDKPDLRIKDLIYQLDFFLPSDLKSMLTPIEDPVIDGFKIHLDGTPDEVRKFVKSFMDSPAALEFQRNPHGPPGIFICDPSKPLQGLQALGHEGIEKLTQFYMKRDKLEPGVDSSVASDPFRPGHLLILQARPRTRLSGGSTALGRLRNQIYHAAVNANLLPKNDSLQFLWVKDFPLFTPNSVDPSDPGQGGAAGFSATHHPFTSPKSAYGVDKLTTDPLGVIADHYDLVVNGVELGGGSRRIHDARMQRFIMKDVLKMSDERLADFEHLFKVLEVAPPHAGFAIGLDRFVAVLTGTESVRDVIAFPKWANGKDPLVGSPSLVTEGQLRPYYLELKEKGKKLKTEEIAENAVADEKAEGAVEEVKPEET